MMKKLFGLLALFVLMASSVLGFNMQLTPDVVSMGTTDSKLISVCVTQGGLPVVGQPLAMDTYCKDLNTNGACNAGDVFFPGDFSAVVTQTPTNASGCGQVTLTTTGAVPAQYAYTVNGTSGGVTVDSASGLVLVPEFTTIGAGLILAGAGAYMYRKRKQ